MRLWITMMVLFLALGIAWHSLGATAWADTGVAGDDGPDIGPLSFITAGSFLGAAAITLVLYLVRVRIGFWLHRPPPGDEGESAQHH